MSEWIVDERSGCVAVYRAPMVDCLDRDSSFFEFYAHGTVVEGGGWELDPKYVEAAKMIAQVLNERDAAVARAEKAEAALEGFKADVTSHADNEEILANRVNARDAELREIESERDALQAERDAAIERAEKAEAERHAFNKRSDEETREWLGRLVRIAWEDWAREQPDCKENWLTPWELLEERYREVDRRIGEFITRAHVPKEINALAAERDALQAEVERLNHLVNDTAKHWLALTPGVPWEGGIDQAMNAAVEEIQRLRAENENHNDLSACVDEAAHCIYEATLVCRDREVFKYLIPAMSGLNADGSGTQRRIPLIMKWQALLEAPISTWIGWGGDSRFIYTSVGNFAFDTPEQFGLAVLEAYEALQEDNKATETEGDDDA